VSKRFQPTKRVSLGFDKLCTGQGNENGDMELNLEGYVDMGPLVIPRRHVPKFLDLVNKVLTQTKE